MEHIKRVKNLVSLALYIILMVFFVPTELRDFAIFAAIVFVTLFVLLLIYLSEPYKKILIQVAWGIVSITFIVLAIHLYQQHKLKQSAEQEQDLTHLFFKIQEKATKLDGFEDELEINYHFPKAGNIASITIYNRQGILVRRLLNNNSIANKGSFTWDGRNEKGQTNQMGIYLIKFDTFKFRRNSKALPESMCFGREAALRFRMELIEVETIV